MDFYSCLMVIVLFTLGKTQEHCEGDGSKIICYNINQQNVNKLSNERTFYSCCGNNFRRNHDYLYIKKSHINVIPVNCFLPFLYGIHLEEVDIESISPGAFDNQIGLLKYLYLSNNHLKTITDGIFNKIEKIEILELQHNEIEEIEELAFKGLSKLEMLLLNNNNISTLAKNVFNSLAKLSYLDVSHNNINSLHFTLFIKNYNLTYLYASHNKIVDLPKNLFIYNKKLSSLDLSYNPIHYIDYNLFLNLQNNFVLNITFIEQKSMFYVDKAGTARITQLILNRNDIKDINIIETNLTSLSLAENNLNIINSTTFQKCVYLKNLNLSINKIIEVEKTAFISLTSLESLDLSRNKIEILPNGLFSKLLLLKYLNISCNLLKILPYGIFDSLSNLISLNISSNQISFYPHTYMRKLKTLYLDNNNIEYWDGAAISSQFEPVGFISLDNNPFTCSNLTKLIQALDRGSVKVYPGNTVYTTNVNQIKCVDSKDLRDVENNVNFNDSVTREFANKIFSSMNDTLYRSDLYSFFKENLKKVIKYKFYNNFKSTKTTSNTSSVNNIVQENIENKLAGNGKVRENDYVGLDIVLYLICITVVAIFFLTLYTCLNRGNTKYHSKGFSKSQTELMEFHK